MRGVGIGRMAVAAVVMGAAVYAFLLLTGGAHAWLRAGGALAVGGAVYIGVAWALGVRDLTDLWAGRRLH